MIDVQSSAYYITYCSSSEKQAVSQDFGPSDHFNFSREALTALITHFHRSHSIQLNLIPTLTLNKFKNMFKITQKYILETKSFRRTGPHFRTSSEFHCELPVSHFCCLTLFCQVHVLVILLLSSRTCSILNVL